MTRFIQRIYGAICHRLFIFTNRIDLLAISSKQGRSNHSSFRLLSYFQLLFWNLLLLFFTYSPILLAQCKPSDEMGQVYRMGKANENQALDHFEVGIPEEKEIGHLMHSEISKEMTIIAQHQFTPILEEILRNLRKHVKRDMTYQVHIIQDTHNINAFSIAGGHIYITTKMLDSVLSIDELAFIIAHEMAHIDDKHSIRKVQRAHLSKELVQAYGYNEFVQLATTFAVMVTTPFAQIDEYKADKHAATITFRAGYNPRMALQYLKRMALKEEQSKSVRALRLHPFSSERYNCLDTFIRETLNR